MKAFCAFLVSSMVAGKLVLALTWRARPTSRELAEARENIRLHDNFQNPAQYEDHELQAPAVINHSAAGVSSNVAAWDPTSFNATEVFTADTRKPESWPMDGVPGRYFANVAVGKTWQGWLTKTDGWLGAARHHAAKYPDDVIILTDTDILNGGCSDQLLFERYAKIVRASDGAPVVLGADLHPWPVVADHTDFFLGARMQARRRAVLGEFNITSDSYEKWVIAKEIARLSQYSFVNAGFIMGPAALVEEAIHCARRFGWEGTSFDDQRGFATCAVDHPEKITIDYSGSLALSTFDFDTGFLHATPTGIVNSLVGDGGPQCFVHLNGAWMSEAERWQQWKAKLPPFTH